MYNIFKYNYILYLQKTYNNKFSLSQNNKIIVLPPIIKKIGLNSYVCFFVINKNDTGNINRPIGLITVNKNKKIKIYDFNFFDFCQEQNFYKSYYNVSNNNFWPNKTPQNEEFLRICLQDLYKIYSKTNIFKGFYNNLYKKYLNNIKKFFPENYFSFYSQLQNNKIRPITEIDKNEREKYFNNFKKEEKEREKENNKIIKENKQTFFKFINKNLKIFIREEVLPSFKGHGTFSKLSFYNEIGNFLKNNNLEEYSNCYLPNISKEDLNINKQDVLNKLKVNIIKIYSKTIDSKYARNNNVDTLSKLLIVFLNCLLIEEIKKLYNSNFENEIAECKEIFKENISSISIEEVKDTLLNYYNNLCKDYLESNNKNFSNIFSAYLFIFN